MLNDNELEDLSHLDFLSTMTSLNQCSAAVNGDFEDISFPTVAWGFIQFLGLAYTSLKGI